MSTTSSGSFGPIQNYTFGESVNPIIGKMVRVFQNDDMQCVYGHESYAQLIFLNRDWITLKCWSDDFEEDSYLVTLPTHTITSMDTIGSEDLSSDEY